MKLFAGTVDRKADRKEVEFYFWIHNAFRRYMEVIMDVILMGLVVVAFVLIVKTIYLLGMSIYKDTDISYVISEIMFIFILIETVRLLIIYLEFHHVAIDTMVEIAIVSVLRELILKGVLHTEPVILGVTALFLLVLGLLLRLGCLRLDKELFSVYKPFRKKGGQNTMPSQQEEVRS
ncbi:MAG: phosphate-starvation-inducible PsiE family protein [Nitrospirota bacterium]